MSVAHRGFWFLGVASIDRMEPNQKDLPSVDLRESREGHSALVYFEPIMGDCTSEFQEQDHASKVCCPPLPAISLCPVLLLSWMTASPHPFMCTPSSFPLSFSIFLFLSEGSAKPESSSGCLQSLPQTAVSIPHHTAVQLKNKLLLNVVKQFGWEWFLVPDSFCLRFYCYTFQKSFLL